MAALRSEVRSHRELDGSRQPRSTSPVKFRTVYLRVPKNLGMTSIAKSQLDVLLDCQVVQYSRIRDQPCSVFKVKILENELRVARDAGRKSGCFVDLWWSSPDKAANQKADGPIGRSKMNVVGEPRNSGFKMTCWNCRGLSSSLPYLETLLDQGSKVLVLSEHWL